MGLFSALSGTSAAAARQSVQTAKAKGQKANQSAAGQQAGRGKRRI